MPKRSFGLNFPSSTAASTAMPCCTALQMANFSDCNQSRTQLRVWWLEPGTPTTLRRFSSHFTHFIGCRCDNASLSSWRHWFTSAWMAEHLAIWPTTFVLPAAVVLVHGQPPAWRWTSLAWRRSHWETQTEHLPSPAGPRVWNSLPPAIRDPSPSLSIFGKPLKTYLFV